MRLVTSLAVILVSPKSPGNIGSSARAMLNMNVRELRLVAPRCNPLDEEARKMAVHAEPLLHEARTYPTLSEAIADRDFCVATTARERKNLPIPRLPSQVRPSVEASASPALVFGPEESGLTSEDVALCQASVRIPTGDYASLNLAQAVLLLCYEFAQAREEAPPTFKAAPRAAMDGMYDHLLQFMLNIGYTDEARAPQIMRNWRTLLDRAKPSEREVQFLRGLWQQGLWAANREKP
ncbi:RNA methyltransferase [Deinococcus yavapaiensis]|uniref:tRNA (cytidine/uridine-2'-O-)-methyltransferase TrmJ n=1 Tax=Deinococcus yavapaiensis KR-236 TaxID=694435 RepID=A0A318S0N4_9DEIO|nr:tRNA/rRNA methyltransferase [Deinococcus yavapaiensis KR-236]